MLYIVTLMYNQYNDIQIQSIMVSSAQPTQKLEKIKCKHGS